MESELLAIYKYGQYEVYIWGCCDEETPENQFDFFDITDKGQSLNDGNPFYEFPSWFEIKAYLEINRYM